MVIRSLLTIQGTLHSLDEIRLWIENRNRSIHVSISPVSFSSLDQTFIITPAPAIYPR